MYFVQFLISIFACRFPHGQGIRVPQNSVSTAILFVLVPSLFMHETVFMTSLLHFFSTALSLQPIKFALGTQRVFYLCVRV